MLSIRSILSCGETWPIALDIGADGVKMFQMRRAGAMIRVSACGRWRFPESAGQDPQKRRDLVVAAVRRMLVRNGFRGRRVVSALSCTEVQIKNVRLPHRPARELEEAVWWEANERFGFDLAVDRVRYLNAGQVRQGAEMRDEIIIFAAPAEVIEAHLSLLDAMGLRPGHIDVTAIALFRGVERFLKRSSDETAVTVLVDIGRSATRVVVARGRSIIFVKSIGIGGQKLNEAVAGQLGITPDEACELRMRTMREHGTDLRPASGDKRPPATAGEPAAEGSADGPEGVDWTVRDALRSEAEALAREIALCLRYCSVTFRGLRPQRVTLLGGEAYDPAVRELLAEHLGIECVLGHPLRGIDVSGVDLASDRRATLVEWSVCAGLVAGAIEIQEHAHEAKHGRHRLSA